MFALNYIFDLFDPLCHVGINHAAMLGVMHKRPASLKEVLQLAGLQQGYKDFLDLKKQAESFFQAGDIRSAFNTINKMWVHPQIVPALLLIECFESRELIVPNWYQNIKLHQQYVHKKDGGVRPIMIAHKRLRLCMSVVNSLLQSCCVCWSNNTLGFRPGVGTQHAILNLSQKAKNLLNDHPQAVLVCFDLKAAYYSVDMKHLMKTLHLEYLPNDMKKLIWMWQHLAIANQNTSVTGLAQGYAYSPTLFAWYVDILVGQHMDFTIYADNVAGVFPNKEEAILAVKKVQTLLHKSGLRIAPSSIEMHLLNKPGQFRWLGHSLLFPDCSVKFQENLAKSHDKTPKVWTTRKWDSMLRTSNWVQLTLKADWRRF